MDIWRFNIRHLRAFAKVIELGTLGAAAKAVNLSQPAVTQGIAKLEEQFDLQLFERSSEGMVPSAAAQAIYQRIVAALRWLGRRNITHSQVRAFLALANYGNLAEAGKQTGLSAVSLHRAIRDLEVVLRSDLTRRKGRGLVLTDFGLIQARRFGLAGAELRYMIDDIEAAKGAISGSLNIGAMPLCRARVLPAAIVKFKTSHPNTGIRISEGSYSDLIEPLLSGELDFLIGALREHSPGPELAQAPLFEDLPVIVGRANHPLLPRRLNEETTIKAASAFPWCVPPSGAPLRDKWEALFAAEGSRRPHISVECGSVIVNRQILMKTDCLTILSPDEVAVEIKSGCLAVVGKLPQIMSRTIGLISRQEWRPTESQRQFLSTLMSVCQ